MEIKEYLEKQNVQYAQMISVLNQMMMQNMSAIESIKDQQKENITEPNVAEEPTE